MKYGDTVIVKNDTKYECGVLLKKYRHNKTTKYCVLLERGVLLSGITSIPTKSCYLDITKSLKMSEKIQPKISDNLITNFVEVVEAPVLPIIPSEE